MSIDLPQSEFQANIRVNPEVPSVWCAAGNLLESHGSYDRPPLESSHEVRASPMRRGKHETAEIQCFGRLNLEASEDQSADRVQARSINIK